MKKLSIILTAILLVSLILIPQPVQASWVSDYKYRQEIIIAGTTVGALVDHRMTLNVYQSPCYEMFSSGWVDTGSTFTTYNFFDMVKIGNTYFAFYGSSNSNIALATGTSATGPWTDQGEVVIRGAGKWDDVTVGAPSVLLDNGTYYLFYESINTDGGSGIGYATSTDGYNWTKQTVDAALIDHGGAAWESLQIGTPKIIKDGSTFYLTYHGHNGAGSSSPRVGVATASSITGPYTKYASNPILSDGGTGTWDDNWVGSRSLFKYGSKWIMVYEGHSTAAIIGSECGIATSDDLYTWTKDTTNNPIFKLTDYENPAFICEPSGVLLDGDDILLFLIWPSTVHIFRSGYGSYGDRVVLNGLCQDDFDDIRFTTIDGTTIPYYVENKTDGVNAKVTLKVPSTPASPASTSIYIYWGNSEATSASDNTTISQISDTFERGSNGDNVSTGSNWTVVQGACTISTAQKYAGTRSCKLAGGATYPKMTIPSSYLPNDIQIRLYISSAVNQPIYPIVIGDGSYAVYTFIVNGQDIEFYDNDTRDTGYNFEKGAWHILEAKNINWTAHTYDLYYDTTKIATANMKSDIGYDHTLGILHLDTTSGHDIYIDNVMDNVATPEPRFKSTSGDIDIVQSAFAKMWNISMSGFSNLFGISKTGMITLK